MVNFDDFEKLEIKIGKIIHAEKVEDADTLLRFVVDFGTDPSKNSQDKRSGLGKRQILSGIAEFYKPEELIGKLCPFLVNLKPRVIRGLKSQGMILTADVGGSAVLLHPDKKVPPGSIVR